MDAAEFLTRVVAPGAYYAFAYKRPGSSGLRHKFFKQTDLRCGSRLAAPHVARV